MGGCFPCFGSSDDDDGSGVKEVNKKDSVKDGSTAQSHRVTRVSSGFKKKKKIKSFLSLDYNSRKLFLGFVFWASLVTGYALVFC